MDLCTRALPVHYIELYYPTETIKSGKSIVKIIKRKKRIVCKKGITK